MAAKVIEIPPEEGKTIKIDDRQVSTGGLSRDELHKALELAEALNIARSPQQRGAVTRKLGKNCLTD